METKPLLIDVHDAAALLSISRARVARLAKTGQIPCVWLPDGELRFSEQDLTRWIDQHKQPAVETEDAN